MQIQEEGNMMDNNRITMEYLRKIEDCIGTSGDLEALSGKTQMIDYPGRNNTKNRLTHTLDVANIAERIAKGIKKRDIFILKAKIAGLCHDIGHCAFGHEGEAALNRYFKAHPLDTEEAMTGHLQNMKDDFGEEYVNSLPEERRNQLYFAHNEHSVRVIKQILREDELELPPELALAILLHSSSSPMFPTNLLGQIVLIADKISYGIEDVHDLKKERILGRGAIIDAINQECPFLSEETKHKMLDIYLDPIRAKQQLIEEAVKEYEESGQITGGYKDIQDTGIFAYNRGASLTEEEKTNLARRVEEVESKYPNFLAAYMMQIVVKSKIHQKRNNKVKDESAQAKIPALLNYFAENPDELRNYLEETGQNYLMERWGEYSFNEQIAYCMASFSNDEIEKIYLEMEHLLPQKLEAKVTYPLGQDQRKARETLGNIIERLKREGYTERNSRVQKFIDWYYDTRNGDFFHDESMLRIRRDRRGGYTAAYKTKVKTKTEIRIRGATTIREKRFPFLFRKPLEAFESLDVPRIQEVDSEPKFRTDLKRRTYIFKKGKETIVMAYNEQGIMGLGTQKSPICTIEIRDEDELEREEYKGKRPNRVTNALNKMVRVIRRCRGSATPRYKTTRAGSVCLKDILEEMKIKSTKEPIYQTMYKKWEEERTSDAAALDDEHDDR